MVNLRDRRETAVKKKFESMYRETYDAYGGPAPSLDFSKIRLTGKQTLEDAVLALGDLKKANSRLADKQYVLKAIDNCDLEAMREISNFFFRTSGIYSRLCRYLAYLYRYDWMITPFINDKNKNSISSDKIVSSFKSILEYLDNFEIKKFLGDTALKVIKNGCYYGYRIDLDTRPVIQELPPNYCRSRFNVLGRPAVEFQMKWFDDNFRNKEQLDQMLTLFPEEFKKGYYLQKAGKLPAQFQGDSAGWQLLSTDHAFKFNINGEDIPFLITVVPALIDLDDAQALDKKKQAQQIVKILVQKMPLDKNGDLIFDLDEMKELHKNAVQMLQKSIGLDVLTTPAEAAIEDLSNNSGVTSIDELEKVERTVYNESGTAQNLFNTDGNLALEKSILNDEAAMYNLLLQFEGFLNDVLKPFNKSKKMLFKVQILTTTIYNYKDMSKLQKEQTQLGQSKMLPQIALGQSQSSILANSHFENDILDLVHVFLPPMMSSTMNGDTLQAIGKGGNPTDSKGQTIIREEKKVGRKELDNDKKSEKTIANEEAKS